MPPEDLSSRPESVRWAVSLALLAFGVGLVNTYRLGPQTSSQINPVFLWSYAAVTSVLWLLVVLLVFRGRNWARIVFVVSALLSIPGTLLVNVLQVLDTEARLVSGAEALLDISAAVLLLVPSSGRWYREVKEARRVSAA